MRATRSRSEVWHFVFKVGAYYFFTRLFEFENGRIKKIFKSDKKIELWADLDPISGTPQSSSKNHACLNRCENFYDLYTFQELQMEANRAVRRLGCLGGGLGGMVLVVLGLVGLAG